MGRCSLSSGQTFPLWWLSHCAMLGSHGCTLLLWWVRQKTQHTIISSTTILILWLQYDLYGYVICLHTCVWLLFSKETNIRRLSVYLGKTATNDTDAVREQRFTVEKLIIHQKYNESNFNNDIGARNCTVCVGEQLFCVCGWERVVMGALCAGGLIAVFVFAFQHCWRSKAAMEDVQWGQRLPGQCVFLHLTLSFPQDFSAASQDLGWRDLVCNTEPLTYTFITDISAILLILTTDTVVCSGVALLTVPEAGQGETALQDWLCKWIVLWRSHHREHVLCWEPWLEHWCLQGEQWTQCMHECL